MENIIWKAFDSRGLLEGRMLSFSKSHYRKEHPEHQVLFNANVFCEESGKIWYGDINLTLEGNLLGEIATELNTTLYVLREMDGRFENECLNPYDMIQAAYFTYHP
jgi:hypothetical protein